MKSTTNKCSIQDCEDLVRARGMCNKHYLRWKNNGDPLVVKKRPRKTTLCTESECGQPTYMRDLCLRHYREWQRSQRDPCSVEGCDEPWEGRGLCVVHYQRFMRTGSTDDPKPVKRTCSVEGCIESVQAKEFCQKHYRNWRRHGTPTVPPRTGRILTTCIIDACTDTGTRLNGMCNRHYRQNLKDSRIECSIPGCTDKVQNRHADDGLCRKHGGGLGYRLWRTYHISIDQFNDLLTKQDGICPICQNAPDENKRLAVDHDHKCCSENTSCGECVRGLLSNACNQLLGLAHDNPRILIRAAQYLVRATPEQFRYDTDLLQELKDLIQMINNYASLADLVSP